MARGREDRGSPNNSDIRRRFMREFEEEIAGGREGKNGKHADRGGNRCSRYRERRSNYRWG